MAGQWAAGSTAVLGDFNVTVNSVNNNSTFSRRRRLKERSGLGQNPGFTVIFQIDSNLTVLSARPYGSPDNAGAGQKLKGLSARSGALAFAGESFFNALAPGFQIGNYNLTANNVGGPMSFWIGRTDYQQTFL